MTGEDQEFLEAGADVLRREEHVPWKRTWKELTLPAPGCRTRFVAFWSELDELMIPVESARVEHPGLIARKVPVRGAGRLALPAHGAVAAGIRHALTDSGAPQSAVGTRESEAMSVA